MNRTSDGLKQVTLVLSLVIVCSLMLATLGGILEIHLLVNFWYLALLGIAAMFLLSALLAVRWILFAILRRFRDILLHWGVGVPGH